MVRENAVLRRLRRICLALPEAAETTTFGHPTFRAGGRTFAVLEEYRGELTIALKAGFPMQEVLLQDRRFLRTPYVGKHGWVSLRVTGPLDWKEVRDLLLRSYRLVAKRHTS